MSRNPKYFRSDDYDAPQLYGDQWGYLNAVLRKCLVTGYNGHTDLVAYQIISSSKVQFTYATAHNYTVDQVLQIGSVSNNELQDECVVSSIPDTLNIICEYYTVLLTPIGTSASGLSGTSVVAPLGFREKFSSGDRSVYVIDQTLEECFLVVDARTPANWTAMVSGSTYPSMVMPNVYMCDGMSDIDTITGSRIVPNDTLYPTRYKDEWTTTTGSYPRKGISTFITYQPISFSSTNTNPTTKPMKWTIS